MLLKTFKSKQLLIIGCVSLLLCALMVGILFYVLKGVKGEVASFATAERVTRRFLESIHSGDIDSAYSLLSEKFSPPVSKDKFSEYIQQDQRIFSTYNRLDICDWGLFVNDGYVIDTSGLMYYDNGIIVVQISLHKDSDAVWRIQGFQFKANVDPKPFGLCR